MDLPTWQSLWTTSGSLEQPQKHLRLKLLKRNFYESSLERIKGASLEPVRAAPKSEVLQEYLGAIPPFTQVVTLNVLRFGLFLL